MKRINYSKIEKEYRTKLAEALWENRKLKQKTSQNSKLKKMVLHEIRSPLGNIINFSNLLKIGEGEFSLEQLEELYDLTGKEAKKVLNISEILYLDGCSRDELRKCPEIFSLEKLALNYSHTVNIDLINERVGVNLKYDKPFQKELEIYSNKAVFETIWGTLTGNALNFAPKQTKIKQGIKFNADGRLEIIMENKHDKHIQKRKFAGLGKGIGLDFTKDIIDNLGGKLEIYKEPIIKSGYDVSQKFGYKEISSEDEKIFDTFAVKIILPKSEISYEPQN